jgi:DNA repair/transcription protein MET18/MMS19
MAACVSGYSISEVLKWAPKIWDSLKFEVWNGENDEFIRGALNVIHAMIGAMGHPTSAWDDVENQYAKCLLTILTECSTRLIDSRQRYMEATGSILYAIASASPYALSWVARKLLPVMFTLWQEFTSESDKTSLLTALNSILQSRLLVEEELDVALAKGAHAPPGEQGLLTSVTQTKSLLASSLVDYQRNLIDDIYFSAMTENISNSPDGTRYRAVTIKGLVLLMSIQNLLSDFEKGTIIESLNSILLKPNQIDTLSKEAVLALQKVSSGDPAKFQKITLTNFMSRLPKSISADRTQRKSELDSVIYLLDSLAKIACTATCDAGANQGNTETNPKDRVFLALQKALVAKLTDIIGHDGQLAYGNIILGAICQGIIWYEDTLTKESKSSSPPEYSARNPTYHPFAWIPLELCQRILMIKQPEAGMPYIGLRFSIVEDERTVDKFISLIGNISTLALRSSQTTAMNNFLNSPNANSPNSCSQVWSVFIENTPGDIDTTQQDLVDGPAEKCLVNALSMSLVAGVRREVGFCE